MSSVDNIRTFFGPRLDMRQQVLRSARIVCLVGGMPALGLMFTASSSSLDAQETRKPNFVFILTDDMRADDLAYMPKTRAILGKEGMRFTGAFVSYGTCCPSRATIMRGQYAHNHGVWYNTNGPNGGWRGYKNHGNERDNVATRLDDAGYDTGLFGKYLNQYSETATIPPGWDSWFVTLKYRYFDYCVNDNGTDRTFGTDEGIIAGERVRTSCEAGTQRQGLLSRGSLAIEPEGKVHGGKAR